MTRTKIAALGLYLLGLILITVSENLKFIAVNLGVSVGLLLFCSIVLNFCEFKTDEESIFKGKLEETIIILMFGTILSLILGLFWIFIVKAPGLKNL